MKSFTIHKLEEELYAALRKEADVEGLSINQWVKKILRERLGIHTPNKRRIDMSMIAGTMSEEEADQLNESIAYFNEVRVEKADE